ncbi:DNA-directed RNA polymerase subunit Rpb12, putative [Bodo saltans]|uniref:DNA-directed RNA polymerase subunit Rpb12, putative n=1 Tax=Bodo saltans TaxID=75058 RepID=A0A0S4J2G8_BODSA|nr:DNA-directed RNA polymerase subunit Rpb12, putative [Bodo saltans]|eukprot:CUG68462.1 DNA-directed RNA polymerase subunit Rpb12, putative [Bodo saltans]
MDSLKSAVPELRPVCTYICASCTYEVAIESEGRLICPRCASNQGSNCVFYKKREQSTTYDTV